MRRGYGIWEEDTGLLRQVSGLGFDVLEATNGEEAWQLGAGQLDAITVVLADMTMPGQDGCELVVAMRDSGANVPAVIMSGYSGASASACVEANAVEFLQKPFTVAELERAVTSAMNARH